MTVSVLVPWRSGCPHREAAWAWVQQQYATHHPGWEIIPGACAPGPYNRAEAILNAFETAAGDVLVVADADVWCDPQAAVDHAATRGWAIPHRYLHRLSEASTADVLAGADWRGLPLSTDNTQDRRPYVGHETGTLVVLTRDVLSVVPPDVRFVGWGSEDDAWAAALHTLVGKPWRGRDDLVHLWHPPQARQTRVVGNQESYALLRRYKRARNDPAAMRALMSEVDPWPNPPSDSTAEEYAPS